MTNVHAFVLMIAACSCLAFLGVTRDARAFPACPTINAPCDCGEGANSGTTYQNDNTNFPTTACKCTCNSSSAQQVGLGTGGSGLPVGDVVVVVPRDALAIEVRVYSGGSLVGAESFTLDTPHAPFEVDVSGLGGGDVDYFEVDTFSPGRPDVEFDTEADCQAECPDRFSCIPAIGGGGMDVYFCVPDPGSHASVYQRLVAHADAKPNEQRLIIRRFGALELTHRIAPE